MKRMKQRTCPVLALVLLAALLGGCGSGAYNGAGSSGSTMSVSMADTAASYPMEPMKDAAMEYGWAEEAESYDLEGESPFSDRPAANVKMIYTASIDMESTEFDSAVAGLEALVAEAGGWVEHSQLNNANRRYRSAGYTVRVPAENFLAFCDRVGEICQVNSIFKDSEDVSEYYYDTESRLATQRTKLERLQALLAQAEDMEDIITLESAISETELAIENLTGTLRKYDSLVGYSTITITLTEVYQLTETEEPAIGFGAKLGAAFRSGSNSFVYGAQDLLLGLARGWTGWLIFLIIVAVVVILIVRGVRKSRKKREAQMQAWAAQQQPPRPTPAPAPMPAPEEPGKPDAENRE